MMMVNTDHIVNIHVYWEIAGGNSRIAHYINVGEQIIHTRG